MTQIRFEGDGFICLDAVGKEEDLTPTHRIVINPPPRDGRCDVCGRHISELKPFGGPGDPVRGDFSGELLVKTFRPSFPLPDELREADKEAQKEGIKREDYESWFIAKHGEKEFKELIEIYEDWQNTGFDQVSASWECRDCIVLDTNEYFEKEQKRYQENGDE